MYIYTAEDINEVDDKAKRQGFSLFALMENAGKNIADSIKSYIDKQADILILAGRGNNGGDGIVLARYLKKAGYRVTLQLPFGGPKTDVAQAHLAYYKKQHFDVSGELYSEQKPNVIVDAMLGVGGNPPLRDNMIEVVEWTNEQSALRYAIDIPTGVSADHGDVGPAEPAVVFQADATFALHGAKPSAFLLPSSRFYGEVMTVEIGLKQESHIKLTNEHDVQKTMPIRAEEAHKGTFGTSLLFAGSDEMPGSALLAAIGAIRSGTGKLTIGTTRFAASIIATRVPEVTYMFDGLETIAETGKIPQKVSAVGIGPGIADEQTVEKALNHLMQTNIPIVIDATALRQGQNWKREAPTVLTPHPGEFSKLTDMPVPEIQANRIAIAQDYAKKQDVILVLKGQHTVIAFPDGRVNINQTGNSGLAKGGSGDVLTGMITSMMSYYDNPDDAVTHAVYLHGLCADVWAETNSGLTMTASDFHALLPEVFKMVA